MYVTTVKCLQGSSEALGKSLSGINVSSNYFIRDSVNPANAIFVLIMSARTVRTTWNAFSGTHFSLASFNVVAFMCLLSPT